MTNQQLLITIQAMPREIENRLMAFPVRLTEEADREALDQTGSGELHDNANPTRQRAIGPSLTFRVSVVTATIDGDP